MYLNIQVDNPVCVLNQDASRGFLRESNPKKRFQLFLKATQFETIIEKLNDCQGPYKHSKLQLDYQRKVLHAQQQELRDVEDKYERLLSLDAVKQKVKKIKVIQSWQQVMEQEELNAEIQSTLNEFEQKYEQLKLACGSKDAMEAKIKEITEQFTADRDGVKVNMQRDEELLEEMRQRLATKAEIHQQMERTMQKKQSKKKRLHTDIVQLEKDIAARVES